MTPRHSAWQAWHLVTFTFVSRGRRGTNSHLPSFCVAGVALMVLGGALGPGLGGRDAAAFCVAGVALGDIHFRFAWQAWHKLTSTVVLRGRRGTYGTGWRPWAGIGRPVTPRHFCVAGVAQPDIHLRFTWQAWHKLTSTARFAWQANWDIQWHWVAYTRFAWPAWAQTVTSTRHFAWQAWHLWYLTWRTFVSRV